MRVLLLKFLFKLSGYISVIYSLTSKEIYKYINSIYPNHIINIKIINTNLHNVIIHGNNSHSLYNNTNDDCYYVISIWNKKKCGVNHFMLNNTLLNNINKDKFIESILNQYGNVKNSNIYAIIICNKDVTHIFEKYLGSISIVTNMTAHSLYLYYCYKYHIQPTLQNSAVTIIDYDLNEKTYTFNDIIICDN